MQMGGGKQSCEPVERPAGTGPSAPASIDDVVRAAEAAGMSYGKYMQLVAAGKAPEKIPAPAPAPAAESEAPEKERKKRIYVTPARRAEIVRSILDGETTIKAAAAAEHVQYNTVWLWVKAARKEAPDGADKDKPAGSQ